MSVKQQYVHIKFQYSPKGNPGHRSIDQVSTLVLGNTESAAMQKLRQMYPNRQDFVILSLQWK
jgi:hypothetical protein